MNGGPETGMRNIVDGRPVPKQEDAVWLWHKR